ncbi:MAG: PHP domain-containing protein [Clostridia bacterium]|nr:PHP domain-containing protein [Clostridia bacterium]
MKIDLHCHSTFSDGVLTPRELVLRAKANNVDYLALTDHDTLLGLPDFMNSGKELNLNTIEGIELTTYYNDNGKTEHIHCVGLAKKDAKKDSLSNYLKEINKKRKNRALEMLSRIHDIYGYTVNLDEISKTNSVITRKSMLDHLVKENSNIDPQVLRISTSLDSKAYVPTKYIKVEDGTRLLKENNFFVIFAHPCLVKNQLIVETIIKLSTFDGIEVKYSYIYNDEQHFKGIAQKYNLLFSAGSDFHSPTESQKKHGDIGSSTLNEDEFKPMKEILNLK